MVTPTANSVICSTFPDVEIPDVSLSDYIRSIARRLDNRTALIDAVTGRA